MPVPAEMHYASAGQGSLCIGRPRHIMPRPAERSILCLGWPRHIMPGPTELYYRNKTAQGRSLKLFLVQKSLGNAFAPKPLHSWMAL